MDMEEWDPDDPRMIKAFLEIRMEGVDTPGCDCGHQDMGRVWHAPNCVWVLSLPS